MSLGCGTTLVVHAAVVFRDMAYLCKIKSATTGNVLDAKKDRAIIGGRWGSVWTIVNASANLTDWKHLPPLRDRPQRRVYQRDGLVAGEAEVDEPLAVERLGHGFEQGDAARVVLDQVVVGAEDGGDFALDGQGRKRDFEASIVSLVRVSRVAPPWARASSWRLYRGLFIAYKT